MGAFGVGPWRNIRREANWLSSPSAFTLGNGNRIRF